MVASSLAYRIECTIRAAIRFLLSPFFCIANAILALLTRRSKTAARILLKAQLIRDILLQSPPPSYQSATNIDQNAARLRAFEAALQKRDRELASKSQAVETQQRQVEIDRDALQTRAAELTSKKYSLERKAQEQSTQLAYQREQLSRDTATLQDNQDEVHRLRDMVARERVIIERQRSENTQTRQRLQEEEEKIQADAAARQQRLDERQAEIDKLHDRFIHTQLETMERHRTEHATLVQSLQSRLTESQEQHQKTEQVRTELEQRLSLLTNELADRTEREFNLGTELGQLRQKLSNERGSFNREFGELSQSLSELKERCCGYVKDQQQLKEELQAKEESISSLEQDVSAREQLLQTRAKFLETLEDSLKAQQCELADREQGLQDREKSLEEKSKALESLQETIDERLNHVAEAERDLEMKTKNHEENLRSFGPSDPLDPVDEAADAEQGIGPGHLKSRPTMRNLLGRRTSDLLTKGFRRGSVNQGQGTLDHLSNTPPRSTKSRDGVSIESK
ncbi:hypothetical protein TWF481_005031 [Arthrobotrys musiformis]|uniref:Uncharacterized protein n=1 Tax=Arthrobotrys musiformis TaxID=47236 RepID=A0AAV9WLA0_9PEZI